MGLAFLITADNWQLLSERKVLKSEEYESLSNASALMALARQEAQKIIEQANEQAELHKREAYAEGFEQAQIEHAQKLMAGTAATDQQLKSLRQAMAKIVVKAVRQFISDADLSHFYVSALSQVDSLIAGESFISMRVSPEQESVLQSAIEALKEKAPWVLNISVTVDSLLPKGACVLQTPSGTLELGVDIQLKALHRAVEGSKEASHA